MSEEETTFKRWDALKARVTRVLRPAPEPETDSAADLQAAQHLRRSLHEWASATVVEKHIIPFLAERVEAAHQLQRAHIGAEGAVCYEMGREDELQKFLDDLRDWRDNPRGPAEESGHAG